MPDNETGATIIIPQIIEDELQKSYLDYAMSVIIGRALPDVRDGLKPVHRRILYAMNDLSMRHNQPYKKCARIVGEVLGKYHPHGDMSVYDALVRMAQDFSLRYPLVDGQGNFGCFTKDTKVQLTDGRQLSFGELIDEDQQGKRNYTYTVDKQGRIKIALIRKPRRTRTAAQIMKVILDNGQEIKCTLNHKFMLRNGEYREAQDLKSGDSLMPLYTRVSDASDAKPALAGYPLIFQPNFKSWEFAHHLADEFNIEQGVYSRSAGRVRHHLDFNKQNASPENIQRLQWAEHWKLHADLAGKRHADPVYVERIAQGRKEFWSKKENHDVYSQRVSQRNKQNWQNEEYRKQMTETLSRVNKEFIAAHPEKRQEFSTRLTATLKRQWQDPEYRKQMHERIVKANKSRQTNATGKKKFLRICNAVLENEGTLNETLYERYREQIYPYGAATSWATGIAYYDDKEIIDVVNDACNNHKVAFTEILNEFVDVYDLTIDGTHNFALAAGVFVHNSVDGDTPAAMRYTEARLAKIADEMLQDLDKETVLMGENFDGSLKEPTVLPAKLPNLLVNGSSGIAVGMATNIPPHNLQEVAAATIALIDNPEIDTLELAKLMPGPDFPTGGIIQGRTGIMQYYAGGRGKLRVKSVITHERVKDRNKIIITELPYQLNKADLITEIADAVKEKRIEGISDIRDESDRDGMRIVIELKQNASPEIVENALVHHTRVQVTFGVNMLAIVDGQPKVLGLKPVLEQYVVHRRIVVRKRTEFDLRKAQDKEHLLEGLVIALDHIDPIIALIKKAKNTDEARAGLMERYKLSEKQSNAILEMRLSKLTGLEQSKIREELSATKALIADLQDILSSEKRILTIIKTELKELSETYKSSRKTQIVEGGEGEVDLEDLIEPEDVVVTISSENYCKRLPVNTYRAQNRGGKGITAATMKEEDYIEHLFIANTHSWLLVFTDKGKVYWTKVYNIPEGSRTSKGKPMINIVKLEPGEKVRAAIPVKEFSEDKFLLFATKNGLLKKTALSAYSNVRQTGIAAINLEQGDDLVTVMLTTGQNTIFLASANGMAVRCSEEDVRPMGRTSTGVIGIRLEKGDAVVDAFISHENHTILTITENGYGKRTSADEYRHISRGGKGVINIITSERNGKVVAVSAVEESQDVMIISKNGITIRTPVAGISVIGRNTQGVRLMNLKGNDKVVACTLIEHENDESAEVQP